jgi:ABC-2 type transport system ATP-binding protein
MLATVAGHDPADVPSLLELVGLADRGGDRYHSYSLGMRQRLGIAAALLGEPELLILDEPANGLDPQGVREIRSLLGRLAGSGRTVLVSSHDLSELEQVCDWLLLIDTGRSLYQGPTRHLLDGGGLTVATTSPHATRTLGGLLDDQRLAVELQGDRLLVEAAGADLTDLAAAVNRWAFEAGIVVVELTPQRLTLEDRYLSMLNGGSR